MSEKYWLRLATSHELPAIRKLVYTARLNPTGLKWQHFLVVRDSQGEIIGCGQIKPHRDGSHELASLVIDPQYRGLGIARTLIEHLIGIHEGDLYLMCRASLGGFYEKFGFKSISKPQSSAYFRRISRLASLVKIFRKAGETLLVMKREGDS